MVKLGLNNTKLYTYMNNMIKCMHMHHNNLPDYILDKKYYRTYQTVGIRVLYSMHMLLSSTQKIP